MYEELWIVRRTSKRSERVSLTVLHNKKIIEIIAEMNQPSSKLFI